MVVRDIMTHHVVTVGMDDTLATAREIFDTYKFHHLIVVEEGRVVGVISDRDLLKNISPFIGKMGERTQDAASLQRRAHQVMTRRLISVGPETPLTEAAVLMIQNKISCLPVVIEGGRCVGIITARDLLRFSVRLLEAEERRSRGEAA